VFVGGMDVDVDVDVDVVGVGVGVVDGEGGEDESVVEFSGRRGK